MKSIIVHKDGRVALVDDADFDWLSERHWHVDKYGYVRSWKGTGAKKICTAMHRLIANPPEGMVVDHIDGNPLNNQRSNLRVCTQGQNRFNSRKRTGTYSRFRGVTWCKKHNRWRASITVGLGSYDSEEEAAKAVDAFVKENRGEFGRLNFPEKQ